MPDKVTLDQNEWGEWAALFGELFPTATELWIQEMAHRMIRTLTYAGKPTPMSRAGYHKRLEIFLESLRRLPDDSIRGIPPGQEIVD